MNAREATNVDELRQKARGLFTRWSPSLPEEEASTTENDENELRMKARDALEKALNMPAEPQEPEAKSTDTDELRQKARSLFTRLAHSLSDEAQNIAKVDQTLQKGASIDTV